MFTTELDEIVNGKSLMEKKLKKKIIIIIKSIYFQLYYLNTCRLLGFL